MFYGHLHDCERAVIELDTSNVNYSHDMVINLNGGGSGLDRWEVF